jgi:hypothetical protein
LIGLLVLSQHVFGWNLRIDQLLFIEPPGALATTSPGRMGITASSGFIMFGIALILLYRWRAVSFAQVLTMVAGFWALLAIIGYTYKAEALFDIARYTGIAFPTRLSNHWITLHETGNVAGFNPLLVMDVWEHAYLLDYKPADRPKYIEAFFSNIDWHTVEERLRSGAITTRAARSL